MKTNYHLRAKRRPGFLKRALLVFLICFVLSITVISIFGKGIAYLNYFFDQAVNSIIPPGFKTNYELAKENEILRERIITLSSINADRNVLLTENEKLKEMLGRVKNEKVVYATVLSKPPYSPYDTFILDIGRDQSVSVDDVVIVENLAVGKIVEVYKSYSKAKLFSSPGNMFEGNFGDKDKTLQATGEGGGVFTALLPIGSSVSEGDPIILPSISSKVFGIVEKVEELKTEGFKKIYFNLPINPYEIGSVGVILSDRND